MTEKILKAKLKDVLREFWKGIRPQRGLFFVSMVAFPISSILQLLIPLFYKQFFDVISAPNVEKATAIPGLVHILFMILLLNLAAWALFRCGIFAINYFESSVMARLKQNSFNYLVDHSYSFFSNTFSGSLVQRVSRFSRSFERLYDTMVFSFIPLVINIIGSVIIVWFQQRLIAYIILIWAVFIMVLNYVFSQWKLKYDLRSAAADSATTARLADAVGNQSTISAFTGSRHEASSFKTVSDAQAKAQQVTWNLGAILDSIQSVCIVAIEFLLFYFSIKYWQQGLLTVGTFVLIQVYIIGLAHRLWDFGRIIRNVYEGFADSQEMVQILLTPHEIKDNQDAKTLHVKDGVISVRDLTFKYGDLPAVYEGLTLTIPKNQKIALVGHSGSGKSTLVKLFMRMYDINSGSISIDGTDIRSVTQTSLREAIAHVPQDPALFHRSLMENIRYGRRDASDEEVIRAATLAHCGEFIDALPQRYQTFVGERGVKLSGGERQRVAIARAILKNAPILILDEATSSLDSHSEALIQEAMDELMKGKTVIAIAHRLSTIRKMDRIIVLDKGKIAEDGTHDELLAKKGIYSELWNHQSGGYMKDE